MNYNTILDMATDLGYGLAMSGAETFRVEESICRVLDTYGLHGEVFAIPNCLIVSIETPDNEVFTKMCRIGHHGNDLDRLERFSNLSRKICAEKPDPEVASKWIMDTEATLRKHSYPVHLLGVCLTAIGFTILFGGCYLDCLFSAFAVLIAGLVNTFYDRMKVNQFFSIITSAFIMAALSYLASALGIVDNVDTCIIGALMILVPGLLFTNAMRDIIYGDTNSGINRIVQVFLIAAAIALGTGSAFKFISYFFTLSTGNPILTHTIFLELIACMVGCIGFSIVFNIQGPGMLLCAIGGMLTWVVYRFTQYLGGDVSAYFAASMFAALYAEVMARIRKYPAFSYLVVSLIPLIPGAGVYYTMNHIVQGDMQAFAERGTYTIAITGAMAVGILLISSIFRFITVHKLHK